MDEWVEIWVHQFEPQNYKLALNYNITPTIANRLPSSVVRLHETHLARNLEYPSFWIVIVTFPSCLKALAAVSGL